MRPALVFVLLALSLPALGCAASDPPPSADAAALEVCPEPRPRMCTKEYRPVCGHRCAEPPCAESERRTYGNACDGCAHAEVVAVTPGACDAEGAPQGPPKLP